MRLSVTLIIILVTWKQGSYSAGSQANFQNRAPQARLANGAVVSGLLKMSRNGRPYHSYTGIPYATVPGRFEESKPITTSPWNDVFDATSPGVICPQVPFGTSGNAESVVEAEDCLNLNVYVPMKKSTSGDKDIPIMLWVHGGGFVNGGGFGYGPQYFMDEDVILVTINYRVGVFGFLSTGDSVVPGNNGLKDIVLAFRGDAGKVTIFGESAGGAAVHYLLLSPTTKGLFHRAISQSGTALNGWAYFSNPRQEGVEIATHLNCSSNSAETSGITSEEILRCLKGLPMEQLNKAQLTFKSIWPSNTIPHLFGPTAEPLHPIRNPTPFLSEPPISTLTRNDSQLAEVPWMVGMTEDEGAVMFAGIILSNPELLRELDTEWEKHVLFCLDYAKYLTIEEQQQVSQKLKEFYFGTGEITEESRRQLENLFNDGLVLHGSYRAAVATASRGKRNPVYLYQYAYRGPSSLTGMAFQFTGEGTEKSAHADELQHLFRFGSVLEIFPGSAGNLSEMNVGNETFSKTIVKLWSSFAIHGEPKHSWGNATFNGWNPISKPQIDGEAPMTWFRIDDSSEPREIDNSVADRMQIWDKILSEHYSPAIMAHHRAADTEKQKTKCTKCA